MRILKLGGVALAIVAGLGYYLSAEEVKAEPKGTKYIGADKCKKCHDAKSKGGMYTKWCETKHSKAFEVLSTDKAKEYAKAKGVADATKDDKCTKCHTTGAGAQADWDKNFKPENVQCEACHGPGEKHFKARMASEDEGDGPLTIGDDEIVRKPDVKTCQKCHNEESPGYKPFCFKNRYEQIMHLDPRKKRSQADLDALKCKGDCGVQHDK